MELISIPGRTLSDDQETKLNLLVFVTMRRGLGHFIAITAEATT